MRLLLIALICLALPLGALAQDQISTVTVSSSVRGARFRVDGLEFNSSATFHWPAGSKHVLSFLVNDPSGMQYGVAGQTRYVFTGWQDAAGLLLPSSTPVLTVTADRSAAHYIMNVTVEYQLNMQFFDGGVDEGAAAACGAPGSVAPPGLRPGAVLVNGTCYWGSTVLWLPAGTVSLNAFPFPGFVFIGWSVNSNSPSAALNAFELTGPARIAPIFSPAKRVRFRTDPPGLRVYVDRTLVRTPETEPCESNNYLPVMPPPTVKPMCVGDFDFADNSRHVLGAPSPQMDKIGRYWVFESFSNGTEWNGAYVARGVNTEETIVAKFVRGVPTYISTAPAGLKVKVNDRDNWGSPFFVFAPGSKQTVAAPAEQVDAKGRRYLFKRWSDGGEAAHEVTVPGDLDKDFKLTAEYELLSQLRVQSNPSGAYVEVDGTRCPTPCTIDRREGTEVRLTAPATIPLSESHRFEFTGWGDGAERVRTVKIAGTEVRNLTVNFQQSYLLRVAASPQGGARFRMEPASAEGYYPERSLVTVEVQAEPGYRFRRWSGEQGTAPVATITMDRPRSLEALLDKVPFIAPAGVRNAAGLTPENVVAPGSLISIFGANLADQLVVGPVSPLAQSLGDVSVVAAGRILPLLFVSPEQINAQLPYDLAEGQYKLVVKRAGHPDIGGEFTVAACAPGLFGTPADQKTYAMAFHAGGSPVTVDSPARRDETITVLATGLGSLTPRAWEGFAPSEDVEHKADTPVEVLLGETGFEPLWAGAMAGHAGVNAVRFRVPADLPPGALPELRLRMQGHESNAVLLPVE